MEKYLEKCLNSVLTKKKIEYIEILIINDGSKDNSLSIAQKYEKQYPQTIKVINKENGNYGSCINRGLKEATGKYVKILDADDTFCTKNLEELLEVLLNIDDVDLVITDYKTINTDGKEINRFIFANLPTNKILNIQDDYIFNSIKLNLSMHAVLYKLEYLKEINYTQTEGISYTDQEWIFIPIAKCNKLYYFNKTIYNYLLGREDQTMNESVYVKNINQLCKVTLSLAIKYVELENKNCFQKKYLDFRLFNNLYYIYYIYIFKKYTHINELINFDSTIKKIDINIYNIPTDFTINRYFKFVSYWRKKTGDKKPLLIKLNFLIAKIKSWME